MTERTDFIATLQACYFGDKNAFEKVLRIYDEKQDKINKAIEYIKEKYLFNFKYDNEEIFEIITDDKATRELLEILKGGNNDN